MAHCRNVTDATTVTLPGGSAGPEARRRWILTIHCFPSGDAMFERRVLEVFARLGPSAQLIEVEVALQEGYPLARVVEQDDLAVRDGDPPLVYAFRDGSVAITHAKGGSPAR
jgi:hypothetical protein